MDGCYTHVVTVSGAAPVTMMYISGEFDPEEY
jgi:hypothetical protein